MSEFGTSSARPDAVQACGDAPPDEDTKNHWIEIELVYENNGEPVPNEEYCVRLPDGSERRGSLGAIVRRALSAATPGTRGIT